MKKSKVHRRRLVRVISGVAVLVASVVTAVVVQAAPASAAPLIRASCGFYGSSNQFGDLCIHYYADFSGSLTGVFATEVDNYPSNQTEAQNVGLIFRACCASGGQGQRLGNNNGSNRNLDRTCYQMLWYSVNQSGYSYGLGLYPLVTSQATGSQLGILRNNLRSHSIYLC